MNMPLEPELWSDETIAEFHLKNALDDEGYRWSVSEILAMGLDPRALNPAHLFQEEPWQNVNLYLDATSLKRTS